MSTNPSRVGKDIEITGTMKFKGELIFEGKFRGNLVEGSALVVGDGAELHAKSIVLDNLTSSGLVDGDATVSQRCHLKETAHLQGSLKTFRLAMDDGATFAGALEISKPANMGGKDQRRSNPRAAAQPASRSAASRIPAALSSVSCHSASGELSATIPAPT
jgi:cytoskeletal protein CcmA (bactofilin family)